MVIHTTPTNWPSLQIDRIIFFLHSRFEVVRDVLTKNGKWWHNHLQLWHRINYTKIDWNKYKAILFTQFQENLHIYQKSSTECVYKNEYRSFAIAHIRLFLSVITPIISTCCIVSNSFVFPQWPAFYSV